MSGLKLSALYGFYPHQLGFCGPREKLTTQVLLDYLSDKEVSEDEVREILKEFKGAYSYYELIAKCNDIEDPFDERVVRAYWIGNELLEKVSIDSLREMIVEEFSKPGLLSSEIAEKKAKEIPATSKPHHSFHVLVLGSVSGRVVLRGNLLDFCRVSWGKVKEIFETGVALKYRPLVEDKEFKLDELVEKKINWKRNFLPQLKVENWVSIHWNHVIQILNKEDLINLEKYTQITIDSLNE